MAVQYECEITRKNIILCEEHFHWRRTTWIKMRLQHRCFPLTEAAVYRLTKIHRKKLVMKSFLTNYKPSPGNFIKKRF